MAQKQIQPGPTIPNPKKIGWQGVLPGRYAGDFSEAFNIDLESHPGKLAQAKLAEINTDSTDVSGMGLPKKFIMTNADSSSSTNAKWFAMCASKILKTTERAQPLTTDTFAADALASTPTSNHDMVEFEQSGASRARLLVSTDTDIAALQASVWTAAWWTGTLGMTALSNAYDHPLARQPNVRTLVIGDGPNIHTVDNNLNAVYNRLQFDPNYQCTKLMSSMDRTWMVFQPYITPKKASLIAEWDGFSQTFNNFYPVDGYPVAGFIVDNIPYYVLDVGRIVYYNGRGFVDFAILPNFEEGTLISTDSMANAVVNGHRVYINLRVDNTSIRMRGGVWVLNLDTKNVYHYAAIGQTKSGASRDFGQSNLSKASALALTYDSNELLIGSEIYTDYVTPTKIQCISFLTYLTTRTRFATPIMPASNIQDYWYNIWHRFRTSFNGGDGFVTKYRVTQGRFAGANDSAVVASATWVNTTGFTCVVPAVVKLGDMVEILAGDNAGCTSHITGFSQTPDGSTLITVTLDEAVVQSSTAGTLVRFDDWQRITATGVLKSMGTTPYSSETVKSGDISSGSNIQFLIEIRGTNNEYEQLRVDIEAQVKGGL